MRKVLRAVMNDFVGPFYLPVLPISRKSRRSSLIFDSKRIVGFICRMAAIEKWVGVLTRRRDTGLFMGLFCFLIVKRMEDELKFITYQQFLDQEEEQEEIMLIIHFFW